MKPILVIREIVERYLSGREVETSPEEISTLESKVSASIEYLASQKVMASIEADPYRPKWDGPWWRMTLLFEMRLTPKIPRPCVDKMIQKMNSHYLHFYPLREEELPPGVDVYRTVGTWVCRNVVCHCALGTMYQVLSEHGVAVDEELPWIRPWFLKYQLPDGGLNCDESAYTKPQPKSSVVSTIPPLEAVLLYTNHSFTPEETRFLDQGAKYLLTRRLFRSLSKNGQIIKEDWLKLCFPRFYQYDILRGLRFIVRWAEKLGRPLSSEAIAEAVGLVDQEANVERKIMPGRLCFSGAKTLRLDANGSWTLLPASTFELLDQVSTVGVPSTYLQKEWHETLQGLARLDSLNLLT